MNFMADHTFDGRSSRRRIVVEVDFAGVPHRFTLNLVPSGWTSPCRPGFQLFQGKRCRPCSAHPALDGWAFPRHRPMGCLLFSKVGFSLPRGTGRRSRIW